MIPKHVIEQIRERTDIVDLIGSFLALKRAGGNFRAICPFHKEKTASFNVNPQRQIYHCFGCGKGGSVFQFLMDYEGVDFVTAVKMLAERANVELVFEDGFTGASNYDAKSRLYKINEAAAHLFHRILKEKPEAEAARQYLIERNLDEQLTQTFQFGFAPERWDLFERWAKQQKLEMEDIEAAGLVVKNDRQGGNPFYDRFRGRIMIPIRDELGRVIAFTGRILEKSEKAAKYVNSPETVVFQKNRILFALDLARRNIVDKKSAIICEGQIDAIRCHQAGFNHTVASQGTALTANHARILKRYCDEVTLVLDPDLAGQNAAMRSYEIFLEAELGVNVVRLPTGEDPDTLINTQGADAFQRLLDTAMPALNYQITILNEREGNSDTGLMRTMKAVLGTIQHAPGAVMKQTLLKHAAELLNVNEQALREDYNKLKRPPRPHDDKQPTGSPPSPRRAARLKQRPPEQITLAELLLSHSPEACELVEEFLPLDMITDPVCHDIINQCLEQKDSGKPPMIDMLESDKEEVVRLSAGLQMGPNKLIGDEATPELLARHCILTLYRKHLEKQKKDAYARMDQVQGDEQAFLAMQASQITEDLAAIRKGWEYAQSVFQH